MKPCQRSDSLLSAYLERETSPAETRFMDGHFTACGRCRQQVEEVDALMQRMTRLPKIEPSPDFTPRVLAQVANLPAAGLEEPVVIPLPERRPAWQQGALAVAATITVALLGWWAVSQFASVTDSPVTGPVAGVIDEAVSPAGPEASAGSVPEVLTLDRPQGDAESLGMVRDQWLTGDYELREPAGGGTPTLTRVGGRADDPAEVVVTF